uniref:Protein downstream neighbor of son homolog n=1 Tax=Phallusia mammillata TaxID=59560 RepID=A0A6F9DBG5_9ASCI|nr:protein downstream neighbor of son homolog [Phallusia mammillata]
MSVNSLHENPAVTNEEWKKPNDLMRKIKIKRKRNNSSRAMSVSQPLGNAKMPGDKIQKPRINPFAKRRSCSETESAEKRRILSLSENPMTNDCKIASSLSDIYDDCTSRLAVDVGKLSPEENKELSNNDLAFVYLNEDSIQGIFLENLPKTEPEKNIGKEKVPPDWSIKTKARFLSPSTFAWCARMKGSEEAQVVRSSSTLQLEKVENCSQTDFRVELGKNLVYWQHPSIPWFNLFPRFGAECKIVPHTTGEAVTEDRIKSSLYDSWAAAFRSVYQLLRQDLCPYFYVCSQMYTALFRSSAVSANGVNCILTPTSLGFRNSLKAEGISFTMPLKQSENLNGEAFSEQIIADEITKMQSTNDKSPSQLKSLESLDKENMDECAKSKETSIKDGIIEEEEAEELSWKKISDGLNLRQCREIATATQSDGLPRTAVLVCGSNNTQLLFNYLLNCRSSIANSGPQAGVPPTILSPHAFMGSTMKKLDYKAGIARTTADAPRHVAPNAMKHNFSLDVSGPLLPHHVFGIMSLLNSSQSGGEYSTALSTRAYTIPFNANSTAEKDVIGDDITTNYDCGLSKKCTDWLRSSDSCVTMRQISANGCKYTWAS